MSKRLLSAALAAVLGVAAFAPATRAATNNPVSNGVADGTITITGTVIPQTCKVDGNAAGTPDNISVQLPDVLTSQLASAGAVAGNKPFSITVSGCDSALTSVQTYFTGSNIDASGRLNNLGSAGNVQVELLNSNSDPMALDGADATAQGSLPVNLDGTGGATLNYSAQYYATGQSSAGDVNTSVAFTMVYQ